MTSIAKPSDQIAEIDAFLTALLGVDADAPTACPGWTAHELLAHVVAGGEELLRLVTAALSGAPVPPTRAFTEREAPFVALADAELRERMTTGGLGLLSALAELHAAGPARTVPFTGAELTAMQLMTHVRSELALHRWDLIGDDDLGDRLLAQPELLAHGRWVLDHMPVLAEAQTRPADDRGDLLVLWGRRSGAQRGR